MSTKSSVFRGLEGHFLGLTVVGFLSMWLGFLSQVFLKRTLSLPHDLDQFWSISLHPHLCYACLVNNLEFISINNKFLMGFNPKVLVLNPNHDDFLMIKVNGY